MEARRASRYRVHGRRSKRPRNPKPGVKKKTCKVKVDRDKGGRSITLRPEGTSGAVRAMLENGLYNGGYPVKMCIRDRRISPQTRAAR